MTDTTPDVTAPVGLFDQATDQRRLMQAAKGLSVLESDMRNLLKDGTVDGHTTGVIADMYAQLRNEAVTLLAGTDALDPTIGLPELTSGDSDHIHTLLVKLSQATRYLATEEAWPTIYVQSRAANAALNNALKSGIPAGPATAASSTDPGPGTYL